MPGGAHGLGGVHQGGEDLVVRHRRELDGGILPAGPLVADRPGGDHQVPALDLQLDAPAGAGADKGVRTNGVELLQGDHRRGAADARRADGDFLPQKGPGVDVKLPVVGHMDGIVKVLGDDFAPPRVPREDAVAPHIPRGAADMELQGPFFLFHSVGSSLFCRWAWMRFRSR